MRAAPNRIRIRRNGNTLRIVRKYGINTVAYITDIDLDALLSVAESKAGESLVGKTRLLHGAVVSSRWVKK
jgi:hypothetical protein